MGCHTPESVRMSPQAEGRPRNVSGDREIVPSVPGVAARPQARCPPTVLPLFLRIPPHPCLEAQVLLWHL
jgi:hypothetical protein